MEVKRSNKAIELCFIHITAFMLENDATRRFRSNRQMSRDMPPRVEM